MKFSKRNPLARNNMEEFNTVIGSLGEEIKEQNLDEINGGTGPYCETIAISVTIAKISMATNDWLTKIAGCGGVISITAECLCARPVH